LRAGAGAGASIRDSKSARRPLPQQARPSALDAHRYPAAIDAATLREIDPILATAITSPIGPEFMAPPAGLAA
jgi:hypothetical protein